MKILILGEWEDDSITVATRHAVTAANGWGDEISLLLVGLNLQKVSGDASSLNGVQHVLCADHDRLLHPLAEDVAHILHGLGVNYDGFLAAATSFGKNIMPRFAALLGVQPLSDVVAIEGQDIFIRPIYAGNALEKLRSLDARKVITVRATAFDDCGEGGDKSSIESIECSFSDALSSFEGQQLSDGTRPELTSARIVISGGRGVGSGENFKLLENLADKLGAAIGASRAAVDAGFVPNDWQVGQTGKIVAPDLYIAVGISGAIQHLAGIKDAKVIVAINKDEEAPIFQIADYGLAADLFKVLPELTDKL